ncbi:ImmA/IrrE family metallo-endopeptidase [Bacteroides sp. 51]|uniref:ImmA/IrrE family metallo-endopeptidase n=1 Tax=Bacteroides sp. 51 TaxID=2302938 RepID=UPI0013D8C2BA|nr:ImmA/IrrE family metallo-endopeptidase [Bacteroides sp. 51]NDV84196.1 ImmA/IrrE family metallo-endopeptidase [Bacteroides sp. 51]
MGRLSTKQKGDKLEEEVYSLLQGLLASDDYLANSKFCQIFKQKAYYSKDRDSNIIVDVSIEVTYPDANHYSVLHVYECKNYKGKVSIDNIEEFASKLSQIAGYNVKGTMITTSAYSQQGLTYARSKGIALARISSDSSLVYDIHRKNSFGNSNSQMDFIVDALCRNQALNIPFCVYDVVCCDSWIGYLQQSSIVDEMSDSKVEQLDIPYISTAKIQGMAESLLKKCVPDVFRFIKETSLALLCECLQNDHLVTFVFDEDLGYWKDREILGKITFFPTTIYVTNQLPPNSHRWRFTLAHEIGHYVLHEDFLSNIMTYNLDTKDTINAGVTDTTIKRMEIQANAFASNLLMPEYSFKALVLQRFHYDKIKGNRIILDDQVCNLNAFYRITNEISKQYNVSKQSAKYRLMEYDFIENRGRTKLIKDFF